MILLVVLKPSHFVFMSRIGHTCGKSEVPLGQLMQDTCGTSEKCPRHVPGAVTVVEGFRKLFMPKREPSKYNYNSGKVFEKS